MVRQRHPLNGRELEQILGECGGQEAWRAVSMGPKRQQQTEVPGQLLGGGVRCVRLMGIQHHSWAPTVTQTVESTCNAGTHVRSLGREDPLEEGVAAHSSCSCLENSMDRGAWWATVHGVAESDMTEQLTQLSGASLLHFPILLFGECHGQRSLATAHGVTKSRTRLGD